VKERKTRVYSSKVKAKVLAHALKQGFPKISLWKDKHQIWHAAQGPEYVPDWATETEHIRIQGEEK
jgi:hypothetical protein